MPITPAGLQIVRLPFESSSQRQGKGDGEVLTQPQQV